MSIRSGFRCTLCGFLMVSLIGCGSSSSTAPTVKADEKSSNKEATLRYWAGLRSEVRNFDRAAALTESETNADGAAASLKKMAVVCQEAIHDINNLPLTHVDAEVVAYATQIVDILGQTASLCSELADWVRDVKDYSAYANSFSAGLNAFVHGYLGDPLTPLANADKRQTEFEQTRKSLTARFRQMERKGNDLESAELTLRAKLSQRYGSDPGKLWSDKPKVPRTFTEQDHAAIRAKLTANSDALGRTLINGTHPTGAFSSASLPTTKLSADSRDVRVTISCFWKGAVLKDTYQTVFTFTINKQSGLSSCFANFRA